MTYLMCCGCASSKDNCRREGIGGNWKSITAAVEKVLEGA
jgi:hypothetical protein